MAFSLCSNSGANTGEILCDVSRGVLKKIFIFNDGFNSTDYATATSFLAALVSGSKLSKLASGKVFPIPEAQDIQDASEANKEGSLGLGFKAILLEGKPAYKVKVFAGNSVAKQLRKFNNQTVRILEYDANDHIWGTKSGSNFVGFKAKLFFTGGKIATGQNVEEGVIEFTVSILSTSEYFDSAYYMPIDGDIEDVSGLNDVNLSFVSKASNAYKFAVKVPTSQIGGSINVYDSFDDELAVTGAWQAFTGASFSTPLTLTSVAKDTVNKCWTVTFDSTLFTALSAGASIKVSLVAPEALDALSVVGIEGDFVVTTK
jgi:hypothetical protein